jgi:hypothetical protein
LGQRQRDFLRDRLPGCVETWGKLLWNEGIPEEEEEEEKVETITASWIRLQVQLKTTCIYRRRVMMKVEVFATISKGKLLL